MSSIIATSLATPTANAQSFDFNSLFTESNFSTVSFAGTDWLANANVFEDTGSSWGNSIFENNTDATVSNDLNYFDYNSLFGSGNNSSVVNDFGTSYQTQRKQNNNNNGNGWNSGNGNSNGGDGSWWSF